MIKHELPFLQLYTLLWIQTTAFPYASLRKWHIKTLSKKVFTWYPNISNKYVNVYINTCTKEVSTSARNATAPDSRSGEQYCAMAAGRAIPLSRGERGVSQKYRQLLVHPLAFTRRPPDWRKWRRGSHRRRGTPCTPRRGSSTGTPGTYCSPGGRRTSCCGAACGSLL